MTKNEYRAKHKRCRTCENVEFTVYGWKCTVKNKYGRQHHLGDEGLASMFCRTYIPRISDRKD